MSSSDSTMTAGPQRSNSTTSRVDARRTPWGFILSAAGSPSLEMAAHPGGPRFDFLAIVGRHGGGKNGGDGGVSNRTPAMCKSSEQPQNRVTRYERVNLPTFTYKVAWRSATIHRLKRENDRLLLDIFLGFCEILLPSAIAHVPIVFDGDSQRAILG